MGKYVDLTGQRFGRLVVIAKSQVKQRGAYWDCECDCGGKTRASGHNLRHGKSSSCGCLNREAIAAKAFRHGMCGSPEYRTWSAMIQRCTNPRNGAFGHYGAVGITVCERWKTFSDFYADMGMRPPGTEIDRIDNSRGYEPGNCRWATSTEQRRNTRRRMMTVDEVKAARLRRAAGESIASIADDIGMSDGAIQHAVEWRTWRDIK